MNNTNCKFNQTEQRQFIDEVYFVNKKKEFNGSFIDSIKSATTLDTVEKALQDKRKAYNYLIVNTFKRYNICPDDLYSSLDTEWDKTTIHDVAEWYMKKNKTQKLGKVLMTIPGFPLLLPHLVMYQFAIQTKWEGYKTAVLLYSDKYSSNLLKNAEKEQP